jgi:TP901 family phage tail tape measure protein
MSDGEVKVGIDLDTSKVTASAKTAGSQIKAGITEGTSAANTAFSGMQSVATTAFKAISALGVGFSLANVVSEVLSVGEAYETSMSNVAALSGATGDAYDELADKARQLGATTTFSASEAADALGYMALAGWDTEEMLEGVDGVLTLAQAGMMDLAEASDLVTDYLSAFNMTADETSRMVDVLSYTQANANTTVTQLGDAFGNCAANANAAGLDIETTSAAIAMMSNQGLKGSEAGTALNAVFRDMTSKMKDGAIAIGDVSVAVADSEGNYRDLIDIIADITAATEGMGAAEKAAAMQSTFTAHSIKGINLLTNAGADAMREFRDELYNCSGAGDDLAATMTDNLEGDMKAVQSATEELYLQIYDQLVPALRAGAQTLTSTVLPALQSAVPMVGEFVTNLGQFKTEIAAVATGFIAWKTISPILTKIQAGELKIQKAWSAAKTTLTTNSALYAKNALKLKELNTATETGATATKAHTVAVKAQSVALKAGNTAMTAAKVTATALGSALKTIAPVAILSLAVEGVTKISGALSDAKEKAESLTKATTGTTESIQAYYDRVKTGTTDTSVAVVGVKDYATALSEVQEAAEECISAHESLTDSISDSFTDLQAQNSQLEDYVSIIEQLAGQSSLTATQQGQLTDAVSGFNSITGASVSVIDAQNGVLSDSVEYINMVADAYEKQAEKAALAAAKQEVMTQQFKDLAALAQAEQALAKAEENLNSTAGASVIEFQKAKKAYKEAQEVVEELTAVTDADSESLEYLNEKESELAEVSLTTADALSGLVEGQQAWSDALTNSSVGVDEFCQNLSLMGISTQDLTEIMETEGQDGINGFVDAYKGGTSELIAWLQEHGYEIPQVLSEQIDSGTDTVASAAQDNVDAAQSAYSSLEDSAGTSGSKAGTSFAEGIRGKSSDAGAAAETSSNAALNKLSTLESNAKTTGTTSGVNFAAGIGLNSNVQSAGSAGASLSDAAKEQMKKNNSDAKSWGAELASNFAQGINSMITTVKNAATAIASSAASVLKHSVPKTGPLHEGGQGEKLWGKHLVQNLTEGMEQKTKDFESAVEDLANTAATRLSGVKVNWSGVTPLNNIVASIGSAQVGTSTVTNSTTQQTINFNQPVQTPAQVARTMRIANTYGLAGKR